MASGVPGGIDPDVAPSGTGCVECEEAGVPGPADRVPEDWQDHIH